ncbi:MAG: hypothetical protein FJZ56_00210 [Chlamydiae bacterium]|nr:hypothetical protein [Chlamydiota bacterium]
MSIKPLLLVDPPFYPLPIPAQDYEKQALFSWWSDHKIVLEAQIEVECLYLIDRIQEISMCIIVNFIQPEQQIARKEIFRKYQILASNAFTLELFVRMFYVVSALEWAENKEETALIECQINEEANDLLSLYKLTLFQVEKKLSHLCYRLDNDGYEPPEDIEIKVSLSKSKSVTFKEPVEEKTESDTPFEPQTSIPQAELFTYERTPVTNQVSSCCWIPGFSNLFRSNR